MQSLVEEGVVPQVGVRKVGDGGEEGHYRQTKLIGHPDSAIQRGVIDAALGPLHPVDDAFASFAGTPFRRIYTRGSSAMARSGSGR